MRELSIYLHIPFVSGNAFTAISCLFLLERGRMVSGLRVM